jgi:hypothetical protein
LENNSIERIHKNTFKSLNNLETIMLDNNKLNEIEIIFENDNVKINANSMEMSKKKLNDSRVLISGRRRNFKSNCEKCCQDCNDWCSCICCCYRRKRDDPCEGGFHHDLLFKDSCSIS